MGSGKMTKHKITPDNLYLFTTPIDHVYQELQQEIVEQVAKRLKSSKDYTKDNVLEWQMDKLNQLHLINEDTIKALSKATGIAEREIRKAIHDIGIRTIEDVDKELETTHERLPMPSNLDATLESYVNQTFRELNNYVNQTLITTNFGQGTVTDMYRKIIEETTGKVIAGTKTFDKAVTETTIKWADRGIGTGFVDRGGNVWGLERYVRTVINSTFNRTYREARISRMDDYDINTVLITSLPDPREACSQIQGKVASTLPMAQNDTGYPSIYEFGYGDAGGIFGINCRHSMIPFIPGVNTNNERQYTESEMTENREARQRQRYLERRIRQSRQSLKVAEIYGDEDTIAKYKKQIRDRQAVMRDFISNSSRTRDYTRERVIV